MPPPLLSSRTPRRMTLLLLALLLAMTRAHVAALLPPYFDTCENIGPPPPVIGVDLGTTYSRVGVYRNGQVEKIIIIANSWLLSLSTTAIVAPQLSPMEVVSAVALARAKEAAEAYLGENVAYAVVTVPAYFNDARREAIMRGGDVTGLRVIRTINESVAASMAYGYGVANNGGESGNAVVERKVLVFDLGGGTLDVSVLVVDRHGYLETLATSGDSRLGGEDFDRRVVDYFVWLVRRRHRRDIAGDARAMAKLRRECERAKRALSSQRQVRVEVEKLVDGVDLSELLTRARFEELNGDLFRKTMVPVRKALADAGMSKADIDDVVLVGGSTWIPKVRQLLKDYFDGKEPTARTRGVSADEAVAYGAALHGAFLTGHDIIDEKTRRCSF